jgi:ribosomal protein S18 acetylase RimI-like enzyme
MSVAPVTVRPATADDADGIAAIYRENGRWHASLDPEYFQEPEHEPLLDALRADEEWRAREDTLALVAEVDGAVAGYLEASLAPPSETARWQSIRDFSRARMHINSLGTADRFKRRGVATALVEAAEEWAVANGASVATLDTWIDSPLSVPFWEERMGYSRRSIVFRKQLRPHG